LRRCSSGGNSAFRYSLQYRLSCNGHHATDNYCADGTAHNRSDNDFGNFVHRADNDGNRTAADRSDNRPNDYGNHAGNDNRDYAGNYHRSDDRSDDHDG